MTIGDEYSCSSFSGWTYFHVCTRLIGDFHDEFVLRLVSNQMLQDIYTFDGWATDQEWFSSLTEIDRGAQIINVTEKHVFFSLLDKLIE